MTEGEGVVGIGVALGEDVAIEAVGVRTAFEGLAPGADAHAALIAPTRTTAISRSAGLLTG